MDPTVSRIAFLKNHIFNRIFRNGIEKLFAPLFYARSNSINFFWVWNKFGKKIIQIICLTSELFAVNLSSQKGVVRRSYLNFSKTEMKNGF